MDKDKLPLLIEMYNEVKLKKPYQSRLDKLKVVPVFKKIIWQTLQNEPIKNLHLTGLIHMFKHDCSGDNFDKYLSINIPDPAIREKLSNEAYETEENGFTNAGKRAIQTLKNTELAAVKTFLLDAFKVKTADEGVKLCKAFIKKNIPIVTEGIYSPWLFYINPTIFPLINDGIKGFKSWIKLSKDYSENIQEFQLISKAIGEENLGLVDALTANVTKEGTLNLARVLYLNNQRLFKISHGIFVKNRAFTKSGIIKILEENNWIALSRYTGKGAGEAFERELRIGDYVYLCYGGDKIMSIAQVISDAKPFNKEHAALLNDEQKEWIYRIVKPIYYPLDSDISDLKSYRSFNMPSGNSTFWEITSKDLESLNENLFIPKFNLEIFKDESEDVSEEVNGTTYTENSHAMALNTILFGPPGTGKTYSTIDIALDLLGEDINASREDRKKIFAEYQKRGKIFFCSFHQNFSYEDFIEGIKPIEPEEEDEFLKYEVQDGLFMKACIEATYSYLAGKNKASRREIQNYLDYNSLFDILFEQVSEAGKMALSTRSKGTVTASITTQGNFAIRHEGKEKPYSVSRERLSVLYEKFPDPANISNITNEFRRAIGGCNSTAYWSVLNKLHELLAQKNKTTTSLKGTLDPQLGFEQKKSIVRKYWSIRDTDPVGETHLEPYIFIIDEINRGNVSQTFGELISLIEDDKRIGKSEVIYLDLPYSKQSFGVPPNLYIIGTMNTADRSVEALDTALRRRFSFVPKMPEESRLSVTNDDINLSAILATLNTRLRVLKDNDHTIGHAWFWNVHDITGLKNVFANKILPLLQEYFYNDYEKLGLLLGDAFFQKQEQVSSTIFANFSGGNGLAGQYEQSWQFELKPVAALTIEDFKTLEKLSGNIQPDETA